MKILLIIPSKKTVYDPTTAPRLGIAYLSAILEKNAIEHSILDLNLYQNWKESISRARGYSLYGITSATFEFDAAKVVAKYIKMYEPSARIILGGAHATLLGEEILKNCKEIDYCIKGEGEESLIRLIHALDSEHEEAIKNVRGVCYRIHEETRCNNCALISELDKIPFPNYRRFELHKYTSFPKNLPLLTSRGCPSSCIYCSVGILMGKKFRARIPRNVIDEIEYFVTKYGTSSFSVVDDNFTFSIERAKEICRLMIERGLDVRWYLNNGMRVDRIDEELVALMKKSGCAGIGIGVESTNNDILRKLKRGIKIEKIKEGISLLKKYKIPIKAFFLIGSPGEVRKDVDSYVKFAIEQGLDNARFGMLTPYPGTELWDWVKEKGYWTVEEPLEEVIKYTHIGNVKPIFETPSFSKREKEEMYQEVWKEWEKYELGKTLKGRIKLGLKRYPYLYTLVRKVYKLFKREGP